jgi:methylmalonyl-CoA/ethylmalonyl-CoA epimerase
VLNFHHIAIAVNDISETAETYMLLGFKLNEIFIDKTQNVKLAFLEKEGHPLIELVEPMDEKSPVNNILQKIGVTPYHLCYEAESINDAILFLKKTGFLLLSKPVVAEAFPNKKICFLYNKSVGLIELLGLE